MEMSAEQELVVGNSWFKKKDVYKYTWLRIVVGRVVDRALMDYVLGNDVSESFPVNDGLTHDCVRSPWLINVYMDGVVREVNVTVPGKKLGLLSANGSRFEIN